MKKEASTLSMLDIHSPSEEVLAALIDEFHNKKQIGKYEREWKKKGETRNSLLEFMNGPVVVEQFARQWIFETKPEWKDRTFAVALWETTGHTLAAISGYAQLYLDRDMTEKFPGYSREQVEKILTQSQFLLEFFRQTIRA